MDTFETIKQFLSEGGKCLLIENGKPIGVVLTMEEYEKLKSQISNLLPAKISERNLGGQEFPKEEKTVKEEIKSEAEQLLIPRINSEPVNSVNPIGVAMVEEMNFGTASANIDEINLADAGDVTLEDLGLDPDMELPKDF